MITLLLIASTAQAESWLLIAKSESAGAALFLDTTSIDRDGELRTARFKSVFTADRPIGSEYRDVPPGARSYRWELRLGHFRCEERTMALSESILHGADDQVVGKIDVVDPRALNFSRAPPESAGGRMLQAICGPSPSQEQPAPGPANMTDGANPIEFYPAGSVRRREQGSPIVQACVGASGALLREPEVVGSSGFPELDAAAIKVAKASRYAAGTNNGKPLAESCIKFKVKFVIKD